MPGHGARPRRQLDQARTKGYRPSGDVLLVTQPGYALAPICGDQSDVVERGGLHHVGMLNDCPLLRDGELWHRPCQGGFSSVIPVNEPRLGPEEVENVLQCVRSGWISSEGQFIRQFEEMWARYCGVEHGVAVTNGTAALEAAVECLGLGPGDEVIMPRSRSSPARSPWSTQALGRCSSIPSRARGAWM